MRENQMRDNHVNFAVLACSFLTLALGGCLSGSSDDGSTGNNNGGSPGGGNSAPTISGTPATTVAVGESYAFTPSASDADDDALTFSIENRPDWATFDAQSGALTGTPGAGSEGTYADIRISVSDGTAADDLPAFSVTVNQVGNGSATLSWTPPTQNEDGSSLTNIAAYKFYYGTSQGSYSSEVRVDNPGLTSYVIDNLSPNTYYFVATVINTEGVESSFSNETSKTISAN